MNTQIHNGTHVHLNTFADEKRIWFDLILFCYLSTFVRTNETKFKF